MRDHFISYGFDPVRPESVIPGGIPTGPEIITGPRALPVSLDDVKTHVEHPFSDRDRFLTQRIKAAVSWLESAYGLAFVLQTVRDEWMGPARAVQLLRRPILRLDAVDQVVDGDARSQDLDNYFIAGTQPVSLQVKGAALTVPGGLVRLQATYRAGFLVPFTADPDTNTITAPDHPYVDDDPVRVSNSEGSLPAGLGEMTDYYAVNVSGDELQLAATPGGPAVDIGEAGSGTHYLGELPQEIHQAICLLVAEMFEHRASTVVGRTVVTLPVNVRGLMHHYWVPTI